MEQFNETKYTKWYFSIIQNAQLQPRKKNKDVYFERHHIVPRSLGGNNNKTNLVLLTAKEHYMCHLLLPKMCIDSRHRAKMVYAFMLLSKAGNKFNRNLKYTSRIYERIKTSYMSLISGPNCYMFGLAKRKDIRKKISETRKRLGLSKDSNNPMFNKHHTDETKQKMSRLKQGIYEGANNPAYGKKRPDLTQRNIETNVRYKIGQYDLNGNLLKVFDHAATAAVAIGAKTHRNINYLAKNYHKYPNRTAYGFRWKYLP